LDIGPWSLVISAMNWLAHFVLSPDDDRIRLGNWLPDVLSRPELTAVSDPMVRVGIELHRRIDETTDRHPAVLAARDHLPAGLRRFAGIVLDVTWDHFLTRDFDRLAGEPLNGFVERVHAGLYAHSENLPGEVQDVLARMEDEGWLRAYATPAGVELTLTRISRRLSPRARAEFQPAAARAALEREYRFLEGCFRELWPRLVAVAASRDRPK
jgi:acyl carrier protein phosphodiesterase